MTLSLSLLSDSIIHAVDSFHLMVVAVVNADVEVPSILGKIASMGHWRPNIGRIHALVPESILEAFFSYSLASIMLAPCTGLIQARVLPQGWMRELLLPDDQEIPP